MKAGNCKSTKRGAAWPPASAQGNSSNCNHISPSSILHYLPACNIPKTNSWQIWSNIFCSAVDDSGNDVTTWYLNASTAWLSLLKSLHILGKPTTHFEIKVTYLATYWQAPHHIHVDYGCHMFMDATCWTGRTWITKLPSWLAEVQGRLTAIVQQPGKGTTCQQCLSGSHVAIGGG